MGEISHIVQFFFSGLTSGSIYALIAVSLLIVYRVSQLICFSQGEFFVFGTLTMATLISKGLPLPLAFAISVILAMIIGGLLQQILIRRIQGTSVGTLIVMTIAISLTLRGLALIIWGRESYVVRPFSFGSPIQLMGASLHLQVFWIIGITFIVLLIIWYFFEKTLVGIAMRACAENPLGASLMGISVQKVSFLAWVFGATIGAVAGMVVAPLIFTQYTSGVMPMVKGFIAMSIGGLSSMYGAAAGGFLLGMFESYTIGLISSKFSDAIVFTLLILILMLKPEGLFGRS